MASGRSDLQPALRGLLPDDLGEVHDSAVRGACRTGSGRITTAVPHQKVLAELFPGKYPQHVIQSLHSEYVNILILDSFHGGIQRQDASQQVLPERQLHCRKRSRHLPDASVQAQLPHDHILLQKRQFPLPGSCYDAKGNRHVISAALLVDIGRSQINDYLLAGDPESHGLKRRYGPEQTFLDGGVCQTYQMNSQTLTDVCLDDHGYGIDSDAFCAVDVYKHNGVVFVTNLLIMTHNQRKKKKNVVNLAF